MIAYEIFLPISAAGFGLSSNIRGLWPEAGLVFLIHLALSLMISLVIFFYMGFHPLEANGYALTIGLALVGLVVLGGFAGFGNLINIRGDQAYATSIPTVVPSNPTVPSNPLAPATTRPNPTLLPTMEKLATPTARPSIKPSSTPPALTSTLDVTPIPTLLPTPVYGRVQSESGGVMVRYKPGGISITTVQNGYMAEILTDTPVIIDGATWVHVIIKTSTRDIDGWVLRDRIETATPSFAP